MLAGNAFASAPAPSREVMWRRVLDDLSFEQARFSRTGSGAEIAGVVLIAEQATPLRVEYRITCDREWRTRTVEVEEVWQGTQGVVRLECDTEGRWRRNGDEAAELAGCVDVDLEVTPATNALPVNRLRLPVGARREIVAAWVRFPALNVIPARQSYERLAEARYRYTGLNSGFTAIVDVDADGLPTSYEGIWRRVAEGPAKPATPGNGMVHLRSHYTVPETVLRLESALRVHGLTIFGRVDHSGEAEKVGLKMRPTQLLIFGSPKAGTPLMSASPTLGIDLPLKALAWEDANGTVWLSYNSPEYLMKRHDVPGDLIGNIADAGALIEQAVK